MHQLQGNTTRNTYVGVLTNKRAMLCRLSLCSRISSAFAFVCVCVFLLLVEWQSPVSAVLAPSPL